VPRLFVACEVPEAALDAVEQRAAAMRLPGRRIPRAQMHLTLQFLGEQPDVDAVARALGELDGAPFEVQLGGAGAFPNARQASVVWLGVTRGADGLARLAAAVEQATAAIGIAREEREFVPHLTLARLGARDIRAVLREVGDGPVGDAWLVDAVTLFESVREGRGVRYVVRASSVLGG